MNQITTQTITVKVPGSNEMQIFVAKPEGSAKVPGLILIQEAFGVNSHIRDLAQRFAKEGYAVVAPELFHRTAPPGFTANYGDMAAVTPHMQALNLETYQQDLKASFDFLSADSNVDAKRVVAIGYCMGGTAAWIANSFLPLKAAASFYGGQIAGSFLGLADKQKAPLLLAWGGADKHIGIEKQRTIHDALKKADKDFVDIEFSKADHGFTCDERASYHPVAAKEAWALTKSFF